MVLMSKKFSEAAATVLQRFLQLMHLLQTIIEVIAVVATFGHGGGMLLQRPVSLTLLCQSVGVVRRLQLETLVLELYLFDERLVHVVRVDLDHT